MKYRFKKLKNLKRGHRIVLVIGGYIIFAITFIFAMIAWEDSVNAKAEKEAAEQARAKVETTQQLEEEAQKSGKEMAKENRQAVSEQEEIIGEIDSLMDSVITEADLVE